MVSNIIQAEQEKNKEGDIKEGKDDAEVSTTEEFDTIPNCESMKSFLDLLQPGEQT